MEPLYTKILLAIDLGPQSLYIARRALAIAKLNQAQCILLHVIEPSLTHITEFNQKEKLIEQNKAAAEKNLQSFCATLGETALPQKVMVGGPENEIIEFAYQQHCDLIILGSHGVGGYTHLLGSTAHTIISEAHCDTLVIQVGHLESALEKVKPQAGKYLWEVPAMMSPQYGSKLGFGEVIKRGPRLTLRPAKFPYKGGTRENEDEK